MRMRFVLSLMMLTSDIFEMGKDKLLLFLIAFLLSPLKITTSRTLSNAPTKSIMNKILERSSQISEPGWLVYNQEVK